jgi:Flp pilus assembly protein TadG
MEVRHTAQKGQAIVLIALMMTILIGFAALAIDSARAFDGRRVLQDSVDAAALAAAESYQNGASWAVAQTNALQIFEKVNRIPLGQSCSPNTWGIPTPGSPATPVVTTCTVSGAGGYVLTLAASDGGPAGQTFALSATRPLSVALMQVLGQSSTITLTAASAATADDEALTPALAGLSQAGCFGNAGTTPLNIGGGTNYLTLIGDVVSNGAAALQPSSYLHIGGDLLTRCGPPSNADHVTYQTGSGNVLGRLRSTTNNFADPGYLPPSTSGLVTQGFVANNVLVSPAKYTADPQFGSGGPYCYFLAGGVYEWQAGLTISGGLVSNELRPPDGAVYSSPPNYTTSRSPDQFWDDFDHTGSASNHLHCDGAFSLTTFNTGANPFTSTQSYSVVITSVRTDGGYARESAPSACKTVTVSAGQVIRLVISNVPGASNYKVYAANGTSCTPTNGSLDFGFVTMPGSNLNVGVETNANLSGCPDVSFPASGTCSLGQVNATYDISASQNFSINPPDPVAQPFAANLPTQAPPRAASSGDLANENLCASAGVTVACPLPGSRAVPANLVTPGAVSMSLTNNSCMNVTNGDAYLFSGYQYNWLLNYEPLATTCSNTWQGRYNSAPIGMTYMPGASFAITGSSGYQSANFGGAIAASILVQNASGLTLYFNPLYAPRPPGTRLTG